MLYVTTRGTQDAFTAHRAIRRDRGPDGGFFVPMRMPVKTKAELLTLHKNTFGQNTADILNLFFGTKFTGWDVDVTIGRRVFTTKSIGLRTVMGRLCQDAHGCLDGVLRSLAERIVPELPQNEPIPNWLEIGIRVAILFGVCGELLATGQITLEKGMDVAVCTGSFAMPMALWYGRQMGLPIRRIICGCNDNGAVWDLLNRGVINTDALAMQTSTPKADFAVPPNLERLLHGALGSEEALHYWWSYTEGESYNVTELKLDTLKEGLFAAVVSKERVASTIASVYRTNQYILDPYGALAYGALSDYRASSGSVGMTLVLTEESPACSIALVSGCIRVSEDEIRHMLSREL